MTELMMNQHPKLIFSDSENENGADMLYATKFKAPDPFFYLEEIDGKKSIFLSDLELNRGQKEAHVDEVISWTSMQSVTANSGNKKKEAPIIANFLKQKQIFSVSVPKNFPLLLSQELNDQGIHVYPVEEEIFFLNRQIKSSEEIAQIRRSVNISENAMKRAFQILRDSAITDKNILLWNGTPLTAEILRCEIEIEILKSGGFAKGNSIVASGEEACDPHNRGNGLLKAHELIIIDIFPRDAKSGYYGDISRTVVRGSASAEQKKIWDLAVKGLNLACELITQRKLGADIQKKVEKLFAENGYPKKIVDGKWSGFFHGLGHAIGLELHESPRFSNATFQTGNVFTVEPGLYIPGTGGVRHEDMILITDDGFDLLTQCEKPFEI